MSNFYLSDVFEDVSEEGQRAREKFGEQSDSTDERWLAILMEEAGEAATEVLRVGNPGLDALLKRSNETGVPLDDEDLDARLRLRKEIVQVAAVAMRWVQSLDTRLRNDAYQALGREIDGYHEHVAGDKHAHPFGGPHSHGGVSALLRAGEQEAHG